MQRKKLYLSIGHDMVVDLVEKVRKTKKKKNWFIKALIILVGCVACFLLVARLRESSFSFSQIKTWFNEAQLHMYVFKHKTKTKDINFL
jgi:hypothetical protein